MSEFHYSPRVGRYLRCKAQQQCPFETHKSTVKIAMSGGGEISTNGHGKVQEVSEDFASGFSVGTGAYRQHFWINGKKMTAVEARIWKREKEKAEAAGVDPSEGVFEGYEREQEIRHKIQLADQRSRQKADNKFYTTPIDQAKLQAELDALFESSSPTEFQAQLKSSSRETKEAVVYLDGLAHAYRTEGKRGLTKTLNDSGSRISVASDWQRRKLEYLLIAGVPLTKTQQDRVEVGFAYLSTPVADEEEAAYRRAEWENVPDYDPEAAERLKEAVKDYKTQSKAKDSLWNRMLVLQEKADGWKKEAEGE